MIRLIASDIDGTLMPIGGTEIPESVFYHIHRLAEKGIMFCPASGRQHKSLRRLFAPAVEKLYFMCENGATLFGPGDPGPLLAKTVMDRAQALALAEAIAADPECEVVISGADTSYLCPKGDEIVSVIRDYIKNNMVLLSEPAEVPEDIVKVSAYCRRGAAEAAHGHLARWSGAFSMAVAGPPWLDFTLADKGTGLARLCQVLGVAPEEVLAFGDNFNDVSLLKTAGTGYIMESADPALLAMFPHHCKRVEDVLAAL